MTLNVVAFFIMSIFVVSCATLGKIGQNPKSEIKKICLNLDGNGRLGIQGHKYVFSTETMLDEEHNKWMMGMNFNLHGQEMIELDLSGEKTFFREKIQEKILRERTGIDPKNLELFMQRWAELLKEVILFKRGEKIAQSHFEWSIEKKQLLAVSNVGDKGVLAASFYNLENGNFSRMDFLLNAGGTASDIKVELIVSKCLDN